MKCAAIDHWLSQHPAGDLPQEAATHLQSCPDCAARCRAITGVDALLRATAPAALPPYFHPRLAARLRTAGTPRPAWVPLTTLAAVCALALLISSLSTVITGPRSTIAPLAGRGHAATPAPAAVAILPPHRSPATRIFPVWPGNQDVVDADDLTITASLYPAAGQPGSVRVAVDEVDLTGRSRITADYLMVAPQKLAPGEHVVTVHYTPDGGQQQTVSWSFYMMEEPS